MTTTNLSALVRYSLRFLQAHWCSNDKTEYLVSMNKISPRISPLNKKRKKQQIGLKTSYTLCDVNTEDTINQAQDCSDDIYNTVYIP